MSGRRVRVGVLVCLLAALLGAAAVVGAGAAATAGAPVDDEARANGPDALEGTFAQSSVSVESVTVNRSTVAVGEGVAVEARVVNSGGDPTAYEATLSVDGEAVETKTVGTVEPGFPVIVPFEHTFEEAGTHTVSVGSAETEVTVEGDDGNQDSDGTDDGTQDSDGTDDGTQDSDGTDDGTQDSDGTDDGTSGDETAGPDQFEVRNVTVDPATATVDETVTVGGEVNNLGDERADFEVQLEVDGEVVDTTVVEAVGPQIPVPFEFEHSFNETGTYTVAVSGVEAGEQVTVEEGGGGGGGGLFGFLGFLPLGLLQPLLLFVGLPVLLVYLALKALAIYLGY